MKKITYIAFILFILLFNNAMAIHGGKMAKKNEFLPVVALVHPDIGTFCTGTILSSTLIVTAAHCIDAHVEKIHEARIYYGNKVPKTLTDQNSYPIKQIFWHPRLPANMNVDQDRYVRYDMGLITLKKEIAIDPEQIPTIGTYEDIKEGSKVTTVGFGLARRTVTPSSKLLSIFGNQGKKRWKEVTVKSTSYNQMIEVEESILLYDSGSGLFIRNSETGKLTLIGIASFINSKSAYTYVKRNTSGFFAPIDTLADWKSALYFTEHARVAMNLNKTQMAYEFYEFALRAYPENNFAKTKRAQLALEIIKDFDVAYDLIVDLMNDDPTHYSAHLLLTWYYLEIGDLELFSKAYHNFMIRLQESYPKSITQIVEMANTQYEQALQSNLNTKEEIKRIIEKIHQDLELF